MTLPALRRRRFTAAALLVACAVLNMTPQPSTALSAAEKDAPNDPSVAAASDEPQQALNQIQRPDGWQARLFAAEPDVANIVAFDVDSQGRLYVVESFRQNQGVTDNRNHDETWLLADLAAQTVQDRIDYHRRLLPDQGAAYETEIDRVRRLVDTDGDGTADEVTTLARGFNRLEDGSAAGILARGNAVYLTCIPKLWKLLDADDDGRVDKSIVMSDGYGVRVAFRGHDLHGLTIGPDGRLYYSIGDRGYHVTTPSGELLAKPDRGAVFRCELDGTHLEVFATGMRNPQELAFNDVGDLFSGDNNSDSGDRARLIHILEGADTGWRMYYQYLPDRGPFNREKIWATHHPEQPAYVMPPIAHFGDGPSGLAYYPGTGFGDQLDDTFLLADFRGGPANSGIRSFKLAPDGAFYRLAEDDQLIWRVLATDVAFGPDGAIWISDWVNGWNGLGKGRVYRITAPELADRDAVAEVQQWLAADWSTLPLQRLQQGLTHRDRRIRLESQWQLAQRQAIEPLLQVATDAALPKITRLHGIWGVDQIVRQQKTPATEPLQAIAQLLRDPDPFIRAAAAKFVGENTPGDGWPDPVLKDLRDRLSDDSARVQAFAAIALGKRGVEDQVAFSRLVDLLQRNDNADPALRHAGVMGLTGSASAQQIATLTDHANESVRRAAVVALRRQASPLVSRFLQDPSRLVVVEAARAIHDEPLGTESVKLAKLIEQPLLRHALTRRVLNANYRLGTAEAAKQLARFAARPGASPEMRLEALAMLEQWSEPDLRDRVLNDYRPLRKRPAADAKAAFETALAALLKAPDAIKDRSIEIAAKLGLGDVVPLLLKRFAATDLPPAARAAALESLARLDPARAASLAPQTVDSNLLDVRMAGLKVLTDQQPAAAIAALRRAIDSPVAEERQQAWDLLAGLDSDDARATIAGGVEAYLNGKIAADTQLNLLEAADGKLADPLAQRLAAKQKSLAEANPLGRWQVCLEGGDAAAGEKLFREKTELSCVRCHKVAGVGGEVGPDLSAIGVKRDRPYLLESIVRPDAAIAEGYETAVIADDLGMTYSGIVLKENEDVVELIQPDGKKVQIEQETIVARRKGQSAMPADIIKALSRREMRDLVAYLASLKTSPTGSAAHGENGRP